MKINYGSDLHPGDLQGLTETASLDHVNESLDMWMGQSGMNGSWQEENWTVFDNPSVRALAIAIYSLISVICSAGNLAVVLVTICHADMKVGTKRYYLYFGHLAFANLCVGIFCIFPSLMMYLHYSWMLGESGCKMYHFITSVFETASVFIFLVFSVESYLAVVQPCTCTGRISSRELKIILFVVWILSLLVSSPKLYYYRVHGIFDVVQGEVRLVCIPVQDLFNSELVDTLQFIFLFICPFVAITCLHIRIRRVVQESFKHGHEQVNFVNANFSYSSEVIQPRINVTPVTSSAERVLSEDKNLYLRHTGWTETHRISSEDVERINDHLAHISECEISLVEFIRISGSVPADNGSLNAWIGSSNGVQSWREESVQKSHRHIASIASQKLANFIQDQNLVGTHWNKCQGLDVKGDKHPQKVLVRMLAVAATSFAICNLPFHLRKLAQNLNGNHWELQGSAGQLLAPLTFLLIYTNCALNPIIFGFMSKRFRTCFKETMRCRFQRESRCDFYV